MEVITLQSEAFQEIMNRLNELCTALNQNKKNPEEQVLDNQQFIQQMKISKRTAQSWRDEGVIAYSQVGSKIYYRMKDVQVLLDKNYKSAFKKK